MSGLGGIDLTNKDLWPSVTAGTSGGGVGSLIGMAGMANPYMAAISTAIQLFGGSDLKVSKAGGGVSGLAESGFAEFGGASKVKFNKPMIDLSNPVHIAVAAAGLVGAIYLYKRFS